MTFVSVIYLTGFNIVVKILLKRSHVLTILGGKGPFYEFQWHATDKCFGMKAF